VSDLDAVQGDLDPFQAEVARIALATTETWSFALAGGNALVAHGMLSRPTQDVDLFTTTAGGPGQAVELVAAALRAAGLVVTSELAPDGEFARLHVSDTTRAVVVDLARDWRAHPPVRMSVGLVLHRDDAVSSKFSAMVGRGLPRDFIDVAAVLPHYDRAELLRLLFDRDPGVRPEDVALAVRQLDLLQDADFAPYGLDPDAVGQVRHRLNTWPRDVASDDEAVRAYAEAHPADSE
jgi:hypothetical protein